MAEAYDVVVVGGGPVGAAFALELHAGALKVALIEAREHRAHADALRPLALSYGSRLIFERLALWPHLTPATPISRIHISQRGRFGVTPLSAIEAGVPHLGYVVDYAGLINTLDAAVSSAGLTVVRGARVST